MESECTNGCPYTVCTCINSRLVENLTLKVSMDCLLFYEFSEALGMQSYQDTVIFIPHEKQAHFGSHFYIDVVFLNQDSRVAIGQLNPRRKKTQQLQGRYFLTMKA